MNARLILGIAALAATSLAIGQDGLINKGKRSDTKRSSPSAGRQSGSGSSPGLQRRTDTGNRVGTPRTDSGRPSPTLSRRPTFRSDDRERPSITFGRGESQNRNNDRNSQLGFPTHDGGRQPAPRNDREDRENAPSFSFGQDGLLGKGKGSGSGGSGSSGSSGGNRGSQDQERQDRNSRLGFPDHAGGKGQDSNLNKRPSARSGGNGFRGQGFNIVNERTKIGPVSIDPLPRDYLSRDLRDQVRHTERIDQGWRGGYYVDNWRWGDRGFIYPFYESSY